MMVSSKSHQIIVSRGKFCLTVSTFLIPPSSTRLPAELQKVTRLLDWMCANACAPCRALLRSTHKQPFIKKKTHKQPMIEP